MITNTPARHKALYEAEIEKLNKGIKEAGHDGRAGRPAYFMANRIFVNPGAMPAGIKAPDDKITIEMTGE